MNKINEVKKLRTGVNGRETVKEISDWIFSFGKIKLKIFLFLCLSP